jgi:hypothetical protein
LATTVAVAEFMLGLAPLPTIPLREDVQEYIQANFHANGNGFCFSCTQDFLHIE